MTALSRRALTWLDGWIHGFYAPSPGKLGLYRMFFVLWLFLFIPFRTRFIDGFPASFFHPPVSVVSVFSGFPPEPFFLALDLFVLVTGCALLLGYRTRWASLLLFAAIITGNSFVFSFGKSIHSILDWLPLVMAFSGWGERYSLDAALGRAQPSASSAGGPVAIMALLLGFGMFTAGFEKALFGWLGPEVQASYAHAMLYEALGIGWVGPGSIRDFEASWLWETADWFVVTLEVGFLFAALHIVSFRAFCTAAAFFHFNNVWFLQITSMSFAGLYPLFFDWSRLEQRVGPFFDRLYARMARRPLVSIGGAALGVAATREGVSLLSQGLGPHAQWAWLALAGSIWGAEICFGLRAHLDAWRAGRAGA